MNNWSPERRRKFAALVVGTLIVLVVLWQGGIVTLQGRLHQKESKIDLIEGRLKKAEAARSLAPKYEAEMEANLRRIRALEGKMAQGDVYRWVINHVLDLQDLHHVTVTSFQPPRIGELDVPPPVPYKSAAYSLNGNAHYHNLGTFLADFENSSPFIRLRGLTIQAAAPGFTGATEPERLAFQVDFSTLISTNAPAP
jgi:hypothetical protein